MTLKLPANLTLTLSNASLDGYDQLSDTIHMLQQEVPLNVVWNVDARDLFFYEMTRKHLRGTIPVIIDTDALSKQGEIFTLFVDNNGMSRLPGLVLQREGGEVRLRQERNEAHDEANAICEAIFEICEKIDAHPDEVLVGANVLITFFGLEPTEKTIEAATAGYLKIGHISPSTVGSLLGQMESLRENPRIVDHLIDWERLAQ